MIGVGVGATATDRYGAGSRTFGRVMLGTPWWSTPLAGITTIRYFWDTTRTHVLRVSTRSPCSLTPRRAQAGEVARADGGRQSPARSRARELLEGFRRHPSATQRRDDEVGQLERGPALVVDVDVDETGPGFPAPDQQQLPFPAEQRGQFRPRAPVTRRTPPWRADMLAPPPRPTSGRPRKPAADPRA